MSVAGKVEDDVVGVASIRAIGQESEIRPPDLVREIVVHQNGSSQALQRIVDPHAEAWNDLKHVRQAAGTAVARVA